MARAKKTIIIGGGTGGLAAGMLLSAKGYEVTVVEKNAILGGRNSRVEIGDYRFDRGPTFLMMPHLLEGLFTSAGRKLQDYLMLSEVDPLYRLQFGDVNFYPTRHRERMLEQLNHLFPGHEESYLNFMKDESVKYARIAPLLQRSFGKLTDYLALDILKALPKLHATDTVYNRLSRYFHDERLKLAFTFQAKYLGMSPWECPGTFTILSYLEHQYGLFHPEGGVNRICHAMAQVIEEYQGSVRCSAGVQRILTKGRRAVGVLLESGEQIEADDVVINADFAHAMTHLFEPGLLKKYTSANVANKKYSCSTFMMYLGVNKPIALSHHNILFSADYRKNVDEMTRLQSMSVDPSIYVHNPSIIDPTLAPEGKSSLYALMPVPNLSGGQNWDEITVAARETVLKRLKKLPELVDLEDHIEVEQILTPKHWEQEHSIYKGAAFNLAHSLDQMMYLRPRNQFEELDHCFLVGGGTHPGSGLPTIIESAKISVDLLMQQYKPQRFWQSANEVKT